MSEVYLRRGEYTPHVWNPKAKQHIAGPPIPVAFHKFIPVRTEQGYDEVHVIVEDYNGTLVIGPLQYFRFTDLPPLAPLDDVPPIYAGGLEVTHHTADNPPVIEDELSL